jgi:HAD superfamily hydrolase (TIGR01490 family)
VSKLIAFFDFDGTVTKRDSLLEFIKYVKGDFSFYLGFFLHSPILVLYKLQLFPNQRAKEIMLSYFFGKMVLSEFESHCQKFMNDRLPQLLRPKALKEIEKLKQLGAEVVIVSASPENWLGAWCKSHNLQCVATKLGISNNRLTGRIDGRNCHGEEKVRRIRSEFNLLEYSKIYAYGDTRGDRHMLALATYKFYRPFR